MTRFRVTIVALVAVTAILWFVKAAMVVTPNGSPTVSGPKAVPQAHPVPVPWSLPVPTPPEPEPVSSAEPSREAVPPPPVEPPDAALEEQIWATDADGIIDAMEHISPALHSCYRDALSEVPDLAGLLEVELIVRDEGGIGEVQELYILTSSSFEDGPLENCLLDAVELLEFEAPEGGELKINYPFEFSSRSSGR
jgi:hypothetical protein